MRSRPPTIRRTEIRVPSPAEVNKLLVEANEPFATLLRLAVATGMRRGEVLGLRWADVDLAAARLSVRHAVVAVAYNVIETVTGGNGFQGSQIARFVLAGGIAAPPGA